MRTAFLALPLFLAACGDKTEDDTASSSTDDTGGGSEETVESFPEGDSTWTGTAEVAGATLDFSVEMSHSAGAIDAVVTFNALGTDYSYSGWGVVDRATGALVVAPHLWLGDDPGLGLVGMTATYDPATGTMTGTIRDTQSWDYNDQDGGPLSLSTDASPATVNTADIAADVLPDETSFSGTFQCLGDIRPLYGSLSRDTSTGILTGELTFEEADGTLVGTFGIEALESEGGLTINPLPWTDEQAEDTNYANWFMHGSLDGLDFTGTVAQHVGSDCTADQAILTFE